MAATKAVYSRDEPALPAARTAPLTSAVRAGWACVAIGLATAWALPFMQWFFGVGVILAIVAMATHQVRAGLLLLVGSVAGAGLCAMVFLLGVLAVLGGLLSSAGRQGSQPPAAIETEPPRLVVPTAPTNVQVPAPVLAGGQGGQGNRMIATHSLRLEDIRLMLRAGLGDAEIIAAIADRQLVEPIGSAEVASLRSLGAGMTLLNNLQGRQLSINSGSPTPGRVTVAATPPPPMARLSTPPPAAGTAAPVDYGARDRRIESLKQQINALDEQVRTVRNNPRDPRYWGHYSGSSNGGVNQPALQKYLDQLDQQRQTLRREKWQLEGR